MIDGLDDSIRLPKEKQGLLGHIVNDLRRVENVAAIVLGGSYAMRQATAASDLDIGIYYSDTKAFSIDDIRSVAREYDVGGTPTVTGFYEWGPWVNGGAWIKTASGKVDLLFRSIERVSSTIAKAREGIWENDYEQQPPYGFSSIAYLAETQCCLPLYDPGKIVAKLKSEVSVYPEKLKRSVIQYSLWSAEFTLSHAVHFSHKQDVYNLAGCLARATKNIVTALFAINEIYPIGDKRAIDILENAPKRPDQLRERVEAILRAGNDAIPGLQMLFAETRELAGGVYQPFYQLE